MKRYGEEFDWLDHKITGYDFTTIAPPAPSENSEEYSYKIHLSRDLSPRLPMWEIDSSSGKAKIITANLFSLPKSIPYNLQELALQNQLSKEEIEFIKENYFRPSNINLYDAAKFYRKKKRVSLFEASIIINNLIKELRNF